ncbi:MAG TPA: hypothetical protein PLJ35_10635 [Anaerolineae bacterium]|nr:hypothetical protein [Anaerolineae bacterium]HOQ99262.1 hypothetical protein [Anaerolineae bacterium]HPL29619.1 hypothetical protein [Anaerolineae bacterium]
MSRRSVVDTILRLAVLLAIALVVQSSLPARRPPRLIVESSVDAGFAALAQGTWQQFLAVFGARQGCFGDVRLRAAWALDSRAGYDPDTATVTVEVPGTPAMLQSALVHEWAHHVEFQCPEQQALRPAFLAAQRLPADTPWRPDLQAESASEQYAEATVELVLGRRPIPTKAHVSNEAVAVIARWAAGE